MSQIKLYKTYQELLDPYIHRVYSIHNLYTTIYYHVNRIVINTNDIKTSKIFLDRLSLDMIYVLQKDHTSYYIDTFLWLLREKQFTYLCNKEIFKQGPFIN